MLTFTTRRVAGAMFTCFILALLAAQPARATATWLSPADLSEAGQSAGSPQVAIDGQGGITAAWSRADGGNYEAQATFRPAGGSWQTPVALSEAGYNAGEVQVAADPAGEVVAVWDTFPPASARTIQVAVKSPLSGSWSTPVTLATIGEPVGEPQVAIDSRGNAIAVWEEQPQNPGYRFIQASVKPAGSTWSAPVDISEDTGGGDPHIAMDAEGNAIATWLGADAIESATRLASTGTWQAPVNVAPSGLDAGGHPGGPELAVNGEGNAVIAWSGASGNGANHIIQAATLVKGGAWQAPVELSSPAMNAAAPHVALDPEGNATAVWSGAEGSNNTVIQSATMPVGGAWQAPVEISETGEKANNLLEPQIAIDPQGDAIAVWEDVVGGNQIIQSSVKSREETSWQTPIVLSGTDANAVYPKVGLDSRGNAVAVWEQGAGSDDIIQAAGYDAGPLLLGYRIPSSGTAGQPLYFSSSSTGVWSALEGTIWNFGDGSSASGANVSHVYSTAGTYKLTLSSVDMLGNTTSGPSVMMTIFPPQTKPTPATTPKLTRVSLTNKRFRVARQRTAVAAKNAPFGTSFQFRLSAAAQVTIAIKQVRQLRGRACSAPVDARAARAHPRRCTRTITVGELTRTHVPTGSNKVSFSGRIGSHSHALSPGNYEAILGANNESGRSGPVTLAFSVVGDGKN
ncbi:MAG TPA: PKD domain-containing protein [Solirubrobacteraceae bacterium]|nr:PKD domain-containing protein [Solirubrobacteraceae bacterium]